MATRTLNYGRLGMTDLEVSPIASAPGSSAASGAQFDEGEAIAAISQARDLGVNLFDTAQGYGFGASERVLGQALREDLDHRRHEVVIATKGGLRMADEGLVRDSSPEWLRKGVDSSLDALGVDHIDVYQVHWPDPKVPFAESTGALQELVDAGKIRHVGVSNFDASQMAAFAETRPVETLQPPYDLFRRGIEDEILPYCREHDIGVLVYGALAHGLLTGAMDDSTAFAADDWRSGAPFFKGEDFHRNLEVVRGLKRFADGRARRLGEPPGDRLDARQSSGPGHHRRRPSPRSHRGQRRGRGADPQRGRSRADRAHHDRLRRDERSAPGDDAAMSPARPTLGFVGLGHMGATWPPGTSTPATRFRARREARTARTSFLARASSGATPHGTSPNPSRSSSRRFPTTTC